MFQIWACKQVTNLAPANGNKPWDRSNETCPSCQQAKETTSHILLCNEVGRVGALMKSIDLLEQWLQEAETDPDLRFCIVEYAKGRGNSSMEAIASSIRQAGYQEMARQTDIIGWRRFMEGMICKSIQDIQSIHATVSGSSISIKSWTSGLIIKLLEITHRQWLYRYIQVHDSTSGTLRTEKRRYCRGRLKRNKIWVQQGSLRKINF